MEQLQLSEDIQFLRNMIENNRRALVDNGLAYISAGVYQIVGSVLSYFLGTRGYDQFIAPLWIGLMVILIAFNLIAGRKSKLAKRPKTLGSQIFNATWIACALPIVLICLTFFTTKAISLTSLFLVVTATMGIGYYITGFINDLTILKVCAFGWWAGTMLTAIWPLLGQEYQLSLLFSVLFTLLELIPGIVIYLKWKSIYHD